MINTITICIAALMVFLCAALAPRLKNSPGDWGFTICWGVWWLVIFVVYSIFQFTNWQAHYWVIQSIDMFGNASLFTAAYALHMRAQFAFSSTPVHSIFSTCLILIVLSVLGGLFIDSSLPSWHVFVMAPSQVLACAAFVALGIAAGTRFPDFRVAIYVICGYYALLQISAYYAVFIEPVTVAYYAPKLAQPSNMQLLPTANFFKGCLAAGKIAFAVYALAILGFSRAAWTKPLALVLSIISICLSAIIIYLRVEDINALLNR